MVPEEGQIITKQLLYVQTDKKKLAENAQSGIPSA